ncbi:hypothetical protein HPB49_024430 [Dermacentor silvarum]|uniref:Uncharacterized protein n=1 Tax=Dermacentor silvarum TaxID=543639 RepID=A0ACB8DS23_DERSI|nr:hypothetical protein HPB49_024430 [Dermacentor silvarum]
MFSCMQDVDEKFARESLRNRLADTEPEVVQAVLALGEVKTLEQACFPSTGYAAVQLRCICGSLLNALASSAKDVEVFHEALHFYRRLLAEKAACGDYDFAVAAVRDGRIPSAMVISGLSAVINGVEPVAALKVLLADDSQGMPTTHHKERLQSLALAVSVQLLREAEDVKWILSEKNLGVALWHFIRGRNISCEQHEMFVTRVELVVPRSTSSDASTDRASDVSGSRLGTSHDVATPSTSTGGTVQARMEPHFVSVEASREVKVLASTEEAGEFLIVQMTTLNALLGKDECQQCSQPGLSVQLGIRPGLAAQMILTCAFCGGVAKEKLVKLVASWDITLKKPNTLLVLLNHEQVPVTMKFGILKLVSRIETKAMLEAAVKVITTMLGPEARDVAPTSPLPAAEARLLEACFAKYNLAAVDRLVDVEGAVETLENALRSTRTCEGSDSVATMALQVVNKDVVKKLPQENQVALLDTLVDLALDTPPSVQHSAVLRALRKVCSFGSLLVEPLQRTSTSRQSPAKTVREAKKMRQVTQYSLMNPLV